MYVLIPGAYKYDEILLHDYVVSQYCRIGINLGIQGGIDLITKALNNGELSTTGGRRGRQKDLKQAQDLMNHHWHEDGEDHKIRGHKVRVTGSFMEFMEALS